MSTIRRRFRAVVISQSWHLMQATCGECSSDDSIKVMVKRISRSNQNSYPSLLQDKRRRSLVSYQKGVALSLEEWDKFNEEFAAIESEVRQLRSQNEQVVPVPPTGVKRNLQSAFDSSYEWSRQGTMRWMCVGEGGKVMHNLCMLYVKDQVRFLFVICTRFCKWSRDHGTVWKEHGTRWTGMGRHFLIMVTDVLNGWLMRSGLMTWPLEWLTNGPPRDWVLLVVGRASSHRLSLNGGRTKARVNSPPSDWVHVVLGQIFISEVLPVIEFMWWQDSILLTVDSEWCQKLGTICNLTTSMSHCLSICIRDGLLTYEIESQNWKWS